MRIEYPDEPMWKPLEDVIGKARCREFMFIGQVTLVKGEGTVTIFLYKHIVTRQYLNLDEQGQSYDFTGDGYVPVSLDEAMRQVLT